MHADAGPNRSFARLVFARVTKVEAHDVAHEVGTVVEGVVVELASANILDVLADKFIK
jgi:hypothetical protein